MQWLLVKIHILIMSQVKIMLDKTVRFDSILERSYFKIIYIVANCSRREQGVLRQERNALTLTAQNTSEVRSIANKLLLEESTEDWLINPNKLVAIFFRPCNQKGFLQS